MSFRPLTTLTTRVSLLCVRLIDSLGTKQTLALVSLNPSTLAQARGSFRSSDRLSLRRDSQQWWLLITRVLT